MEKQKRVWLSKREKGEHLNAWQESKLSKREYCKQNQLSYGTFLNWLARKKKRAKVKTTGKFIPVQVKQMEVSESSFATISYRSQLRIELHQSVSSTFIRELMISCK